MRQLLLYISVLLLFSLGKAWAQGTAAEQKRLIYFTDKANTPYSLQQPQEFLSAKAIERRQRQNITLTARDLPVDPAYVAGLKEQGVPVV
mgnify:FL=1